MADDLTEGVDPNERALESTREFESEILSVVDKIFLEMKPRFDHLGLHSKGPEIARGTNAGYWSEVRLWLWAGE